MRKHFNFRMKDLFYDLKELGHITNRNILDYQIKYQGYPKSVFFQFPIHFYKSPLFQGRVSAINIYSV